MSYKMRLVMFHPKRLKFTFMRVIALNVTLHNGLDWFSGERADNSDYQPVYAIL
jgi:hypothetical protein